MKFRSSLQSAVQRFFTKDNRTSVAWRLLVYVLLVSSMFACLQTAIQIYLDYRSGISHIESQFRQIKSSYRYSLARSIWEVDRGQVKSIASGISSLPGVELVIVDEFVGTVNQAECSDGNFSELARVNSSDSIDFVEQYFFIYKNGEVSESCIGKLTVRISLAPLYKDLTSKFIFILIFQLIKTLSVSIFILAIFHYLVARHLQKMVDFTNTMDESGSDDRLVLEGSEKDENELTTLAQALNSARENMHNLIDSRSAQVALEHELQSRVEQDRLKEQHNLQIERKNHELASTNEELLTTIEQLESTQGRLVRSEKMASLGNMVRGVAHELNTPIGVAATGASLIQSKVSHLQDRYQQGSLTSADLDNGLESTCDSADVVVTSLGKASKLISTFKMVSADENQDQKVNFDVIEHTHNAFLSFGQQLEDASVRYTIRAPESLTIHSYPSALYQIFTQLIHNSLLHGFVERKDNVIDLSFEVLNPEIRVVFKDNGQGMDAAAVKQIFEPFYTTSTLSENTGLGMNMVYNLVRDKFKGSIEVNSAEGLGIELIISFAAGIVEE